ncbi:MAG: substrate-binding domain-containing protein [Aristaeellaceae bacterium]
MKKQQHAPREGFIPVLWSPDGHETPLAVTIAGGIRQMAARKGCDVRLYCQPEEVLNDEDAGRQVIVIGLESARMPEMLSLLQSAGKQVVVTSMDMDHIDSHYSCATFSRRIATEQMLDFLTAKGCQRIALVGCGDLSINDMVCSDALKKYLARRNLEGDCFAFHQRIEESFDAFYARRAQFDSVICPNDYAAVLFLRYCGQHRLQVPGELLVAALKDNCISRYCKPSLTSLSIDFLAIGKNAVIIWDQLRQLDSADIQMRITVPGKVIERESTAVRSAGLAGGSMPEPLPGPYQGGPFYQEPLARELMLFERCLQACDELDLRIIGLILQGRSYESISEALFLSDSSLQYRVRKIFRLAQVDSRRSFEKMLQSCFTAGNSFL